MKPTLRVFLLAVLLLTCGLAHAIEPLNFDSNAQRLRFQNLTSQLRCMVCQNENLADSNAKLASDMRRKVLAMMKDGKSDAQIKEFLVDRYSTFVLYKPPMKPATWGLWFGPGIIVLLGGIAVVFWLRRRASRDAVAVTEQTEADWEENW